jgi:hypothetical protein
VPSSKVCPKSRCCKDDPRCKRCPVVLKRLEQAGLAERTKRKGKPAYLLSEALKGKQLKAARAR